MNQNIVLNRFDVLAEQMFMNVFISLKKFVECSYMFYAFEEKETLQKISFSTNKEWQSIYVAKGLSNNCPLLLTGRQQTIESHSRATILEWNNVIPSNRTQAQVNGIRSDFNIANGISFSQEFWGTREMLGIAAERGRVDFSTEILVKYLQVVRNHLIQLRQIAINSFRLNRHWLPENFQITGEPKTVFRLH